MQSIQDFFSIAPLNSDSIKRLAVFRCKKGKDFEESYPKNVKWLQQGITGWWEIHKDQDFQGIVLLLDSAAPNLIEIWVGQAYGDNSGRFERNNELRWKLKSIQPFELVGVIKNGTVKRFLGKQPGNGVTYIDRTLSTTSMPQPSPSVSTSKRGFNPEFTGEKGEVTPGKFKPRSDHGKFITKLYDWLKSAGFTSLDNQTGNWDLHGYAKDKTPHLFELKTNSSTSSVYTAVGQLKIYELDSGKSCKWAVLPAEFLTKERWKDKLGKLDIGLITYNRETGIFTRIESVRGC